MEKEPKQPKKSNIQLFSKIYTPDDQVIIENSYKDVAKFIDRKTDTQSFDMMIEYSKSSTSIHAKLIEIKAWYIYGHGWKPNMNNPLVANNLEKYKALMADVDGKKTHINHQLKYVARNFSIHDTAVWMLQYDNFNKPRYIHQIDTKKWRSGLIDKKSYTQKESKFQFLSNDWDAYYCTQDKYPTYNPSDYKKGDKVYGDSQIMVKRLPDLSNPFYTLPSYMSAQRAIVILKMLDELSENEILNGFHNAGMLVTVENQEDTKQEAVERKDLEDNLAGLGGAGGTLHIRVKDMANAPQYTPLQRASDTKNVQYITEKAKEDIMIAHGANNSILGLPSSTGILGGAADAQFQEQKQWQRQEIDIRQDQIEQAYNEWFFHQGFGYDSGYIEDVFATENLRSDGVTDTNDEIESPIEINTRSKMSGRQNQMLERIATKYDNGKITLKRAIQRLKDFGYTEDEARDYLIDEDEDEKLNND